ncbi:MAG: AGE family epimerase/isomerase [Oscillospiraceae bacterium]|nr:AGE family epimerase/isomerase [Oscillospiraceae bacterium]
MLLNLEAKQMLENQIIPFWQSLQDKEHGGYYGWVSHDLQVNKNAEKGCILNSRILWFFATAAKILKRPDLREYADHAYRFLREYCLDSKNGGIYWSLNYDGSVLDSTKYTYNQAFAIYALSAYYETVGDLEALRLARALYRLIEEKCTDGGGYGEAFDEMFRPISNEKLSENNVIAARTMNTVLHIFEGYSGLLQADPDSEVANSMRRILKIFREKIYNPALHRQEVFFDADMNSILDLHSYGHDIEASWLIDWGCALLDDEALAKEIGEITSDLARQVYETAYHNDSVWNEREKGVDDETRIWWVQAEAAVGFLNQYQKHPQDAQYMQAAAAVWGYIKDYMVDSRPGSEWFWEVDNNGNPNRNKPMVEPWKCPYHNGRMCFEILRRWPLVTP